MSRLLWDRLKKHRLIALLAPEEPEDCLKAYEALHPMGVVLEIALRTPVALEGLQAIRQKHPEALVMAGTVMTRHQAECVIDAGVAGVVSADYVPIVVEACAREDIMCIPGGLGDVGKQLVHKAELYNCELDELRMHYPYQWVYKIFPAMTGSLDHLEIASAWKKVYKGLNIVYAGGVTTQNIDEIVSRDPEGILCASALTREVAHPDEMKRQAEHWLLSLQRTEKETEKKEESPKEEEWIQEASPQIEILEKAGEIPQEPVVEETSKEETTSLDKEVVVTLGEAMLRLSSPKGLRFGQSTTFDATFGGAEANVAVALANNGIKSRFVTAFPDHALGQMAVNELRSYGVDTQFILRQGHRVGIYFLEHGASQRPSQVIYDRKGSSFSEISPGQVDWEAVFKDANWFHWSGITPALSDTTARATLEALQAAKEACVTVSCDLNYRSKLWSKKKAQNVMTPLMKYVDVVIGNEEDFEKVFGIQAEYSDLSTGALDIESYQEVAKEMVERFELKMAAITLRESLSASDNVWSGCLYNGMEVYFSKRYTIHIVDRIGGGDAFTSGLIYSLISGKDHCDALEFAVAASCLKQTISGDFNLVSAEEIEALAAGEEAGRILR